MQNDPWAQIATPSGSGLAARRCDAAHAYDFYWAKNREGQCLLILEYPDAIQVKDRRPKLAEIQIVETTASNEPARFILKLMRDENREIFYHLCRDIVDSTRLCSDARTALATTIRRTWRWHRMLKGGRDERLSSEAQKGLIGELRVLELALLPKFSATAAVGFWRGPEGSPKDFSIGDIAIEAKAKRGAARPFVKISSEHQLDNTALAALFLTITYIDEGAPEMPEAQTIADYVSHVAAIIENGDAGALGPFEDRLDEAGFSAGHDYSDSYWVIGKTRWYTVKDGFPRIVPTQVSSAVSDVTYNLAIASCEEWETDIDSFSALIGGSQS